MYNRFVGARKDVLKTSAFWTAILLPLIIALAIGLLIYHFDIFRIWLSDLWGSMKFPIAIASLSIPLATWAIANHGSARVTETLRAQDRKQLSELYFEQEKLFEKIMTRKIKHAEFKYITVEDLPAIHATIFDYKNLHKNGSLKVRVDLEDKIKNLFQITSKINQDFYEKFRDEKNGDNDSIKMCNLTAFYMKTILHNLMALTECTGCRVLREDSTSIVTLVSAYVEIEHLMGEINNYISDNSAINYMTEDDMELFNAIIILTTEYHKIKYDELTIGKLIEATRMNVFIKHTVKSDLHRFISHIMDENIKILREASSHLHIQQVDSEYLSLKIHNTELTDYMRIFFSNENAENSKVGTLYVEWHENVHSIDITCEDMRYCVGNNSSEQNDFIGFIHVFARALSSFEKIDDIDLK